MADDDAAHWAEVARRAEARAAARAAGAAGHSTAAAPTAASSSTAAAPTTASASSSFAAAPRRSGLPAAAAVVREGYPCGTCGELVPPGVPAAAHATSLIHQLAKEAPHARQLHLTEANKGYQLLQRMGWKEDQGLGAAGQGRLQPVPSVLKEDRRGLGRAPSRAGAASAAAASSSSAGSALAPHAADGTARVTHFPSHSDAEAARSRDGLSRAQREQLLRGTHVLPAAAAASSAHASVSGGALSSSLSGSHGRGGGGDVTARAALRQAQRDGRARDARREARRLATIRAEVCRDDDLPAHLLAVLTTGGGGGAGGPPTKRHKKG
jgi:hypothetical protein